MNKNSTHLSVNRYTSKKISHIGNTNNPNGTLRSLLHAVEASVGCDFQAESFIGPTENGKILMLSVSWLSLFNNMTPLDYICRDLC